MIKNAFEIEMRNISSAVVEFDTRTHVKPDTEIIDCYFYSPGDRVCFAHSVKYDVYGRLQTDVDVKYSTETRYRRCRSAVTARLPLSVTTLSCRINAQYLPLNDSTKSSEEGPNELIIYCEYVLDCFMLESTEL